MAKDKECINEHIRNRLSPINTLLELLEECKKFPERKEVYDGMINNLIEKSRESITVLCRLGIGVYEDEYIYNGGEVKFEPPINVKETEIKIDKPIEKKKDETPKFQAKPLGTSNELYTPVTTVDIDGVEWFCSNGYNKNRPEERKLQRGDAIIYKADKCDTLGFMIIKSFDYPADHAARAAIGRSPYKHSDGRETCTYYDSYAPGFCYYRFATEDEIKQFFKEFNERESENKCYSFYVEGVRNIASDKYDKYFIQQ